LFVARLSQINKLFSSVSIFSVFSSQITVTALALQSHDWKSEEFPKIGSTVQVKWTDGLLYDAEYRGHSVQQMIKVKSRPVRTSCWRPLRLRMQSKDRSVPC